MNQNKKEVSRYGYQPNSEKRGYQPTTRPQGNAGNNAKGNSKPPKGGNVAQKK